MNKATAECLAGNYLDIQIGGTADCVATFDTLVLPITQEAKANCELTASFVNEITTTISTQIENIVKSFIEQDAKNEQGFFALALSLQVNQVETSQKIASRISNYVKQNVSNECMAQAASTNTLKLIICAQVASANIPIQQRADATAIVNCVSNTVLKSFIYDAVLNDLLLQTSQKQASKQEGLDAIFKWLIIGAAIIAVILIIGVIVYLVIQSKSGGGGGPPINVNVPSTEMIAKTAL